MTLVSMIIFHDLMDSFASSDLSHPGIGVQFLYPWKKHIAAPIPLFYGFHHKTFNQLISLYNLKVILIEIVLWGSVNVLILSVKNQRPIVL